MVKRSAAKEVNFLLTITNYRYVVTYLEYNIPFDWLLI